MNNTQQKYIKERLNEITRTLQNQINKNYPIPEVTIEDKINRIKEDKFEIIPNKYYISLDNCIKFTESKEDKMIEARRDAEKRLAIEKVKLMDQIMLGDVAEAVDMLAKFSEFKI